MCMSLRRVVNIIWSLPGLFITILGIMSLIQGDLAWTAAFLSVGIPFVWLGIGDLFLIQYIKRHSEYLITENDVIIMKHYKEDFVYKIPIKDIQQIDIFGRCKETASIKFVVKDCVYSALARKYEEDIFYDLLEAEKVVSFIREQTRNNICIFR